MGTSWGIFVQILRKIGDKKFLGRYSNVLVLVRLPAVLVSAELDSAQC